MGKGTNCLLLFKNCALPFGLRISAKCVDHILDGGIDRTVREMIDGISQLGKTIKWEMEDKLFMYIPPARAERYDLAKPFGPEAAKNFPSAIFDEKEAGNCFASG
jgi:hypothetical protein